MTRQGVNFKSCCFFAFVLSLFISLMLMIGINADSCLAEEIKSDDGKTLTLSGSISTVDIDSSVTKVILSYVTQGDSDEIKIRGDVVLELADGSINKLGTVTSYGNLEITGSGKLSCDGIVTLGDALLFDHTGEINVGESGTCSFDGDIYFNSGTTNITVKENYNFPVMTYAGSVYLNGGSLNINGCVSGFYAGSMLYLNGGKLNVDTNGGAAFNAGKGENNAIVISDNFSTDNNMKVAEETSTTDGVTITTIVNADGNAVSAMTGTGPDSTSDIEASRLKFNEIFGTDLIESDRSENTSDSDNSITDNNTADSATTAADTNSAGSNAASDNGSNSESISSKFSFHLSSGAIIAIVIVLIIALTAVVAWLTSRKQGKKSSKQGKEKSKKGRGKR